MAAVPASNPSLFSNSHGVNTHGGQHNAAGHDIIHMHFYNSSGQTSGSTHENVDNISAISDRPGPSTSSSGPLFRFPDVSRFFRTRSWDIDVISIVEAEYSSLLSRSSATAPMVPKDSEMYQRLMLKHRYGYPLYHPEPKRSLPIEYRRKGIGIGDVGRITPDGAFDFLFNVDSSQASLVNPSILPRDFETVTVPPTEVPSQDYFQSGQSLLSDHVHQIQDMPITYKFSAPEGSVLQLPEGATLFEAENTNELYDLATRHARSWYEYMFTRRSRDIPNGSLYLVTGCIKTRNWGIGALYGRPSDRDYLAFISEDQSTRRTYCWRKSGPVMTKVGPTSTDAIVTGNDEPNQCVFIRGYKIALGEKLWKKVRRKAVSASSRKGGPFDQPSSATSYGHHNGVGNQNDSLDRSSTPKGSTSGRVMDTDSEIFADNEELDQDLDDLSTSGGSDEESESIILEPVPGTASPAHPSDIIISVLMRLEPEAEVALVHDSEWLSLLPKNFVADPWNLDIRGLLESIARLCLSAVDRNGCVSLVRKSSVDFTKDSRRSVLGMSHASGIDSTDIEEISDNQSRRDLDYRTNKSEGKATAETSDVTAVSGSHMRRHSAMVPTLPDRPSIGMTVSEQGFPNEMIEEILNHLDFPSMIRCRAVCSAFQELIDSSPFFQWQRELAISGMEDGGNYPLSTRRQMLGKHQQGWANLQWTEEQRRKKMHDAWEFKGNVFGQCDSNKTTLYFHQLASPARNIQARCWTVDIRASEMSGFTMDPTQDLLVIFGTPFRREDQWISKVFLWTLSTGDLHPHATGTRILTHTSMHWHGIVRESSRARVILGENLCLLFYGSQDSKTEIKVWNWKAGQVVTNIVSDCGTTLAFLSERHIMIPTMEELGARLVVIDFIAGPPKKQKLMDIKNAYTFRFPPFVEAAEVVNIYVSSGPEPNWRPHPALSAPFFTARQDRIYAIDLCVNDDRDNEQQVKIIAPGNTFLSLIENAASLKTACFDWPMWGPDGTRMLVSAFAGASRSTFTVYGMKLLSTRKPAGEHANYVYVYDFNQWALKWGKNSGNGTTESTMNDDVGCLTQGGEAGESVYVNVMEPTKLVAGDIFQGEVETRLGYRMNRWAIPGQPRVRHAMCTEDGIIVQYGESRTEEFHMLTV